MSIYSVNIFSLVCRSGYERHKFIDIRTWISWHYLNIGMSFFWRFLWLMIIGLSVRLQRHNSYTYIKITFLNMSIYSTNRLTVGLSVRPQNSYILYIYQKCIVFFFVYFIFPLLKLFLINEYHLYNSPCPIVHPWFSDSWSISNFCYP